MHHSLLEKLEFFLHQYQRCKESQSLKDQAFLFDWQNLTGLIQNLSIDTEPPETLPALFSRAQTCIEGYWDMDREKEGLLEPALDAFLQYLPSKGSKLVALTTRNCGLFSTICILRF